MATPAITYQIARDLGALASSLTSALSPLEGLETAVKSGEDMVIQIAKLIQSEFNARNTPQMVSSVEAQNIEKDRQRIENDVAKNDILSDQRNAGQ
jgi:hypothetical protein